MPIYQVEDTTTGRKYQFEGDREPTQTEIEDYIFGTITAGKPSGYRKAQETLLGEETYKMYQGQEIPLALDSAYAWSSRQLDRISGVVRALVNIKSPVEGFLHPEQFPSANASKAWGIDDPVQAKWVDFFADIAVNAGAFHLAFNTLPRAIIGLAEQGRALYTGVQGKELDKLKVILTSEFTAAGMDTKTAATNADAVVARTWNAAKTAQKTPWNIQKTVDYLQENRGKLGMAVKQFSGIAKEEAAKQGFTDEWFKSASEATNRLLPYEPRVMPRVYRPLELPGAKTKALPGWGAISLPYEPPDVIPLDYKGVPESVAKDLPNEVISSPTVEWIQKSVPRYPQKIVDQKSLEEVGNQLAKDKGIIKPIKFIYRQSKGQVLSGQARVNEGEVEISVPRNYRPISLQEKLHRAKSKWGDLWSVTDANKLKILDHELSHFTAPLLDSAGNVVPYAAAKNFHHTIFMDEVNYSKEANLIKRELVKKGVTLPQITKPSVPTEELSTSKEIPIKTIGQAAVYKIGNQFQVFDVYGNNLGTYDTEIEANVRARRYNLPLKKDVEEFYIKSVSIDSLIDDPDLARKVLANPEEYNTESVKRAQSINSESGQLNLRIIGDAFKGTAEVFDSVDNVVKHPVSKGFIWDLRNIDTKTRILTSDALRAVDFFSNKFSVEEDKMLSDILEGKTVPFKDSTQKERLTDLAKRISLETDKIYSLAQKLGVEERTKTPAGATRWIPIRKVENYVPRVVNPEIKQELKGGLDVLYSYVADLRNSGRELTYDSLMEFAQKGGHSRIGRLIAWTQKQNIHASPSTILKIVDGSINEEYSMPYGHLERPRTAPTLPPEFYERRASVLFTDYFHKSYHRLNEIEAFGQTNEKELERLAQLERENPKESKIIRGLIKNYRDRFEHKVATNVATLISIMKVGLGTSEIPNLAQLLISTIPKQGVLTFLRGALNLVARSKTKEMVGRTGFMYTDIVREILGYREAGRLRKVNDFLLRWKGFKGINRLNALLTASSTESWIENKLIPRTQSSNQHVKRWAFYQLDKLGIKPEDIVEGKLPDDKTVFGMIRATMDAQLFSDITSEPLWLGDARNRWMAVLKRFGIKQPLFIIHKVILDEMRFGNPLPLLRLVAGGILGGAFVGWSKRKIWDGVAYVKEKVFDRISTPPNWYENMSDPDKSTWLQILDLLAQAGTVGVITDLMRTDIEGKWKPSQGLEFAVTPAVFGDVEKIGMILDALVKSEEEYGRFAPRGAKRYLNWSERIKRAAIKAGRLTPLSSYFQEGK